MAVEARKETKVVQEGWDVKAAVVVVIAGKR
jgi:hypothetical protein